MVPKAKSVAISEQYNCSNSVQRDCNRLTPCPNIVGPQRFYGEELMTRPSKPTDQFQSGYG